MGDEQSRCNYFLILIFAALFIRCEAEANRKHEFNCQGIKMKSLDGDKIVLRMDTLFYAGNTYQFCLSGRSSGNRNSPLFRVFLNEIPQQKYQVVKDFHWFNDSSINGFTCRVRNIKGVYELIWQKEKSRMYVRVPLSATR